MKKFSFKLQPVHDLREAKREEAERALASASARVRAEAGRVEEARREHERTLLELAEGFAGGDIDPRRAEFSLDYLSSLDRRRREAQARLAQLEAERERVRLHAAEAARAAEATEKLRERARARHAQAALYAEQSMLDELATLAQARAMLGGEGDGY